MVKFKNGVKFDTIAVYGGSMNFQSANRDTLEFRIAEGDADFDSVKAIFCDEDALSEITVIEGEVSSVHLNYTLPVELALREIDGSSMWCMKLAQKSALEISLDRQAADINDTQLALIELASLVSGGEVNG